MHIVFKILGSAFGVVFYCLLPLCWPRDGHRMADLYKAHKSLRITVQRYQAIVMMLLR